MCDSPSCLIMDQIVIGETAVTPCSISAVRISASVIPFRPLVSPRRNCSCSTSSGLRWPSIRNGAVLPVSRTRRTSLITADALTAKRAAASRAEAPLLNSPD